MHESSANAQNLQLQHATMEEMSEPAEGGSDAHLQPERSRKVRSAGARRGFLARPLAADEVREVAALEQLGFLFVQLEEAVTHSIPDGLNRKQNSRPVNSNSRSGCFSPTADVWILD